MSLKNDFKNFKKVVLYTLMLFILNSNPSYAQVFEDLNVIQCDSLIMANQENPNFVVLDVRRSSEYNPQHLEGAINRNYYDGEFSEQLELLNKQKTYLIHCKSGSRSGAAHDIMFDLGFTEVYNMLGGINAWNNGSLPTTNLFAPKLMFVSDSIYPMKEVNIGVTDTISLIITNRANALLIFNTICSVAENEFFTDFNPEVNLFGAEDYQFNIYYSPVDENPDSISFCIESEGGTVNAKIFRNGVDSTTDAGYASNPIYFKIFPNPAFDYFEVESRANNALFLELLNLHGDVILRSSESKVDISSVPKGIYILRIKSAKKWSFKKLVVE